MATISSGNDSGLSSLSACVDDTNSVDDGSDSDLDAVMLEASQRFVMAEEKHCDCADGGDSDLDALMLEVYSLQEDDVVFEENRFAFVTDEDIVNEVEGAVPEKTKKQTRWCYNVFTSWRESRLRRATCEAEKPPELCKMTKPELCLWLPRFILKYAKRMVQIIVKYRFIISFVEFNVTYVRTATQS